MQSQRCPTYVGQILSVAMQETMFIVLNHFAIEELCRKRCSRWLLNYAFGSLVSKSMFLGKN